MIGKMLVSPLYKNSGKHNDPSNYRPISVIPVVAKVFGRIIYDQLYVYLTKYNLLSKYQSGFRSLHSTVTALLEATDSWALNIDRELINAVVFLDLKKVFDTVDHEILLSKLRSYGIRGLALRLFRYLVDRTQICQLDCSKSTPKVLNKFIFRNDTSSYRLRNSEMRLALPQPRTDYVRKSFSYSIAALWNSLPTDIRVSKTLGEFKTKQSNFSFE